MKNKKLYIALILFVLGIVGILSMLTTDIPMPQDIKELLEVQYSPFQIKLLLLINPTFLLIVAITVGIFTYDKVNLRLPVIEYFIDKRVKAKFKNIIIFGIVGGIIAGLLMILVGEWFSKILPDDLSHLSQDVKPTLALRLLYGGLTEEILMRFGVMSLMVWLMSLIISKKYSVVYWLGITLSSFIFALGHFPVVFNSIENPSFILLIYILIGNSAGGFIFGWLYWKKGLESAFIAHMFAHITMITGEYLVYTM